MFRRVSCLFVLVLVAMTVACGGHRPPQVNPELLPPPPQTIQEIPSCWDLARDEEYREWFDNRYSCVPVVVQIVDMASEPSRLVCLGVLEPGRRQLGPATWAHFATKEEGSNSEPSDWVVNGAAFLSLVTPDRTQGNVIKRPVELSHVNQQGWFTRYIPCPR